MCFWESQSTVNLCLYCLQQSMRFFVCFPFCPIMATLPSELPSDNVPCHRALTYLRALFIDTCTSTDHTHAHTTALQTGVASPPLRRASPAAQLPTYISSWKRSRWPHDLLFEEDLVDTQSRPSTIQLHPRELRRICWTLLEWYSVSLRALVKIHLHVYGQPGTRINRCFTRFKLLPLPDCYIQFYHGYDYEYDFQYNIVSTCRGNS